MIFRAAKARLPAWATVTRSSLAPLLVLASLCSSCELPTTSTSSRPTDLGSRAVYCVNGLAETLSAYDPDSGLLYNDVIVTGQVPNAVIPWDGKLFVVNSMDNSIQVFQEDSYQELVDPIDLGTNRNPWTLIVDTDSHKGYIPNYLAGSVSVIALDNVDLYNDVVVSKEIEDVGLAPEGGCFMNGYVYVGITAYNGSFGEGKVAVIDTSSDTVVTTLSIEADGWTSADSGANPQSIIPFPDRGTNGELFVVCTGENGSDDGEVVVIDVDRSAGTWEIIERIAVGGSPIASADAVAYAAITGDTRDRIYLSGVGGISVWDVSGSPTTLVEDSDFTSPQVSSSTFLSGACYIPATDGTDAQLLVCDFSSDTLLILDPTTGEEIDSISASDGPQTPALYTP